MSETATIYDKEHLENLRVSLNHDCYAHDSLCIGKGREDFHCIARGLLAVIDDRDAQLSALRSPEHLREVAERIAQSMTDSMRHSFRIVTGRELSKSVADQFRRDEIPDVLAILTEAFRERE